VTVTAHRPDETLWQLRPGVYSVIDDGTLRLTLLQRGEVFGPVTEARRAALRLLAERRCADIELIELTRQRDDAADGLPEFLAALRTGGWLMATVRASGSPMYTVQPVGRPAPEPAALPHELMLSRFALIRREAEFVVQSPRAWGELRIHDPRVMAAIAALAGPTPTLRPPGGLPPEVAARLLRDLYWLGLATSGTEEDELRLSQWRPHDLWFHYRSRAGEHAYFGGGFGRTMWARGRFDPIPARPAGYPGTPIDLPRPDLVALRTGDMSLTTALENRRSARKHDDDRPITIDQLGELLYRCARVRGRYQMGELELLSRPYPSGGAAYELELYPVVRKAAGLTPGMYHYDSHEHQLRPVCGPSPAVGRLIRGAVRAASTADRPQVLIVLAARFGRLMWTYEEMPYAAILKHVGVLYQTMYLVATAMGLAACGLGAGEATAFADATGADPLVEGSVGEFILGSRAAEQ
jgi:SagB-type dehydrogenase family enzyme